MDDKKVVTLCENLARRYKRPDQYDDLVQEGLLVCYEILQDDPEPHPAHLWRSVNRRLHDYLNIESSPVSVPKSKAARAVARRSKNFTSSYSAKGVQNLREAIHGDTVELGEVEGSVPDCSENYEERVLIEKIFSVADKILSEEEMLLLKGRYMQGKSQEALAVELGTTQKTISSKESSILEKIRNNL